MKPLHLWLLVIIFITLLFCPWAAKRCHASGNSNIHTWASVSVKESPYNAKGDGTTDDTAAFQSAINSKTGSIYAGPGTFVISAPISIGYSNAKLFGAGPGITILKILGGASVTTVSAFDIGVTIDGTNNQPISFISISDLTIDGNKANNSAGANDLTGWGILTNAANYCHYTNIHVQNCWTGGISNSIDSNNCAWANITVNNCGHSVTAYFGDPTINYPAFDVNASQNCSFVNIVTNGGFYGCRLLNNCWGNFLQIVSNSPANIGLVLNDSGASSVYNNIVDATINSGCAFQYVGMGPNCFTNTLTLNLSNGLGGGVNEPLTSPVSISGNSYYVNTSFTGLYGSIIGGSNGTWTINSYKDGTLTSGGANWICTVSGVNNQVSLNATQQATPTLRGLTILSGATNNNIISYTHTKMVQNLNDSDGTNSNSYPRAVTYLNALSTPVIASVNVGPTPIP